MSEESPPPAAGPFSRFATEQARLATVLAVTRLRAGRSTVLRVSGRSMYPFLVPGQRVLLEPTGACSLRRGDLVAFERGGRVVLHRVLGVNEATGRVTEKGDNVRQANILEACQVIGRASAVLAPKQALLNRSRYTWTGQWLARLSALQHHAYRFAVQHRRTGRLPLLAFTVLLRLAAALARPPR